MTTNVKSVTQHFMFWLLIAFIAGFAFSEILVRVGVNPLRSSAFMGGDNTFYCNDDPNDPCVSGNLYNYSATGYPNTGSNGSTGVPRSSAPIIEGVPSTAGDKYQAPTYVVPGRGN